MSYESADGHIEVRDARRALTMEIMNIVHSDLSFTDLHIEEDQPAMIRAPGGWEAVENFAPPTCDDMEPVLLALDQDWQENIRTHSINRPYTLSEWTLRVNAYLVRGGKKIAMSIRRLPATPLPLEKTGLPGTVRIMATANSGIVLVSGKTGAGKSTTLAAMLDVVNSTRRAHIITVEDPLEYIHPRKLSIMSHREVGADTTSFSEGTKDALRQRPDVLLIGEIRDVDTARNAILAAESGHMVFASIHASSAPGTLKKLLGYFPQEERTSRCEALSSSLVGVVYQALLPRKDGKGFVVAPELLFNHKQTYSPHIAKDDFANLERTFAAGDDSFAKPMEATLIELVRSGMIDKQSALQAATQGLSELAGKLREFQ